MHATYIYIPCTMWHAHMAGLMSCSHVHIERESVARIKMQPEHEKVVACIPSVGRITKVSKTPKRAAYTFHDVLSQNGYNFLAKDDGHEPLSGGKQV